MAQLSEAIQGTLQEEMLFSDEEWAQTPKAVQEFVWARLLCNFQAFVERGGESQRIGEALLAQAELMFQGWH